MKKATKAKKNNLDERQEQALLKTESKGFWLVYWLLLAIILIELMVATTPFGEYIPIVAGEWIVFMVMCVYTVSRCMKDNVWDRRLKPNFKTNLLLSLVAGAVIGIVCACMLLANGITDAIDLLIAAGTGFVGTAGLCLIALSICAAAYKKKKVRLEAEEVENETETEDGK